MDSLGDHIVFAKQRTLQELQAKNIEVSAGFLHASADIFLVLRPVRSFSRVNTALVLFAIGVFGSIFNSV